MWRRPTCIFHTLSPTSQNPRHTRAHTLDRRTHTRRGYQVGRAEPGLDPGRPKAQISTALLLSALSLPQQGRGRRGAAGGRGVSVYCHIRVKITGKPGASTEESHKHHVSRDPTGKCSDSGSTSRGSPLPSLNPHLGGEGGAATNSSDEQAQPRTRPKQMRCRERPRLEWGSFSSL